METNIVMTTTKFKKIMTIQEAIQSRHSVRSYTDKEIEPEKLSELRALTEQCNREGGLNIQLITGDPKAFGSRLARYGKFSGVSNYFALIGPKSDRLDEKLGYYGERLALKAQTLGLNTCWVGLTYKKNPAVVQVGSGEKLRCVIALGYGETQGVAHKVKTVAQVARADGAMPEWFRKGVEAALLAPTAINQQKFLFTLRDGNHVAAQAGWGFFTKIDLGIAKLHFEVGAGKENFEWV